VFCALYGMLIINETVLVREILCAFPYVKNSKNGNTTETQVSPIHTYVCLCHRCLEPPSYVKFFFTGKRVMKLLFFFLWKINWRGEWWVNFYWNVVEVFRNGCVYLGNEMHPYQPDCKNAEFTTTSEEASGYLSSTTWSWTNQGHKDPTGFLSA